jgi:hypothetical protein
MLVLRERDSVLASSGNSGPLLCCMILYIDRMHLMAAFRGSGGFRVEGMSL